MFLVLNVEYNYDVKIIFRYFRMFFGIKFVCYLKEYCMKS